MTKQEWQVTKNTNKPWVLERVVVCVIESICKNIVYISFSLVVCEKIFFTPVAGSHLLFWGKGMVKEMR